MTGRANWRAAGRPAAMDEFGTPRDLFDRLDTEFRFGLDAASRGGNAMCATSIDAACGEDGLRAHWCNLSGGAPVWLNPPYSKLPEWIAKAAHEGRRCVVVALVPADPSTRWWRVVRNEANEIRFVDGRVRFVRSDGGDSQARTPSAVVVFRPAGGPARHSYMRARLPDDDMPLFRGP